MTDPQLPIVDTLRVVFANERARTRAAHQSKGDKIRTPSAQHASLYVCGGVFARESDGEIVKATPRRDGSA